MMRDHLCVVTACTNGRGTLFEDQATAGARFIAYVDQPASGSIWEQRPASGNFLSQRRNSRIHKILIHQYVEAEYSLWMDANIKLLVPAGRLIEEWLGEHDMAIFKHRIRDCLYQEASICAELKLDEPHIIERQAQTYRQRGFPPHAGLAEACVILRRHTRAVEQFNNAWWSEYTCHSVRDQISLMVAAQSSSVALKLITPTRFDHPYFHCEERPPGTERPVEFPADVLQRC